MMDRLLRRRACVVLLFLLLGSPCQAAPSQGIAVIVSPGNSMGMSLERLSLVYRKKKNFWEDGQKIQPVNLPASHPVRRNFSLWVLNHAPEEMEDYWKEMYFQGIQPPFVLASEEAVIRFVASTPGAIGYVNRCLADHRVRILLQQEGGAPCSHP